MNKARSVLLRLSTLVLSSLLLVGMLAACGFARPAPPAPNAGSGLGNPPAPAESLPGSSFNRFFPTASDGFDVTYTQEKAGFAEARLSRGGTDVALMSVSDTAGNPAARTKYETATMEIGGFPAVNVGSNGLAVLVADRFQVQVRSTDPSFTLDDAQRWLERFNLNGIAGLS